MPGIAEKARGRASRSCILVSACLLGEPVRYDGCAKPVNHPLLEKWRQCGLLVPVCPELLGGLGVPRGRAQIVGGTGKDVLMGHARVVTERGEDVTEAFVRGARAARTLAEKEGCAFALLKEKSPSCGVHRIYDGTFSDRLRPGMGVSAAMLEAAGLRVFSEEEIDDLAALLDEPNAPDKSDEA